jgi:hypothetical protein
MWLVTASYITLGCCFFGLLTLLINVSLIAQESEFKTKLGLGKVNQITVMLPM